MSREPRANSSLTAEELEVLREMARNCRAYEYAKKQVAGGQDKRIFWDRAVSMYHHGSGVAFFTKRATAIQHRRYAVFEGLGLLRRLQGMFFTQWTNRVPSR